jgi:hypothetical protein
MSLVTSCVLVEQPRSLLLGFHPIKFVPSDDGDRECYVRKNAALLQVLLFHDRPIHDQPLANLQSRTLHPFFFFLFPSLSLPFFINV